jgi:AcrR family transcriptional regulator
MLHFWAAGYGATLARDLGDALGLGAASHYNAFGEKRTLFTQCLDRSLDASMRARITRMEKTLPPRQTIEAVLTEIVERSLESRISCLLANRAVEVRSPHDSDITEVVEERVGELGVFFPRCIVATQCDGSITSDIDSVDAARILVTTVMRLGGYAFAPLAHDAVIHPASVTILSTGIASAQPGERLGRIRLIGGGLVIAGIVPISSHGLHAASGAATWIGDLLFFTSTVLWVVFAVLIRHWRLPSIPAIAGVPVLSLVAIVPGFLGWYGSEYLRARPLVPMAFQALVQGLLLGVVAISAFRWIAISRNHGTDPRTIADRSGSRRRCSRSACA